MPTTTRLESKSTHIDSLVEELKSSGGFCILPSSALEMILQDNQLLRTETHNTNGRVATALERISEAVEKMNGHFETSNTQQTTNNNELLQRLDQLIEKVSNNNSLPSTQSGINIDTELKKRKETLEKIIRNEETSKYYTELVGETQPFVRREYRTHVNKTTAERELVHRRQQAIDKVNTEIRIMKDRVTEYNEKKFAIDQTIEEYLSSHEDLREDIEEKKASQERTLLETFQRNTLSKMKETDDKEKMNSFEYLLKYTDSSSSLNYRGGRSRPPHRRPYRGKRGQQEF